jgi:hypothetical protein
MPPVTIAKIASEAWEIRSDSPIKRKGRKQNEVLQVPAPAPTRTIATLGSPQMSVLASNPLQPPAYLGKENMQSTLPVLTTLNSGNQKGKKRTITLVNGGTFDLS